MKLKVRPIPKYTIWVDQDSTIYEMAPLWFQMHNEDHPEHIIKEEHVHDFDVSGLCSAAGCTGNLYDYFEKPKLWNGGSIIQNSDVITAKWVKDLPVKLGVLTTLASGLSAKPKMDWLEKNFPHIPDLVMVNGRLKHLLRGDILIDDGAHNLIDWQGIGILYNASWNKNVNMLRAGNWDEVDYLVRRSIKLLEQGYSHKQAEDWLRNQQQMEKNK